MALSVIAFLAFSAMPVKAQIDGHGPDTWRVTGVSANDSLNARMGPGTSYPVIDTFAHDQRGLQQITCVPFYTAAHHTAMSQAQIEALPARWCLMRDQSMSKAGWVAQRYITPDDVTAATAPVRASQSAHEPYASGVDVDPIAEAQGLVREVFERERLSESNDLPSALDPSVAQEYFTDDVVAWLSSGNIGAHPLYGAQDFDGTTEEPTPDPDRPMYRGMIAINVDLINFGQKQRAVFYLRADATKPGAPLRIFRVEHDGWSYP